MNYDPSEDIADALAESSGPLTETPTSCVGPMVPCLVVDGVVLARARAKDAKELERQMLGLHRWAEQWRRSGSRVSISECPSPVWQKPRRKTSEWDPDRSTRNRTKKAKIAVDDHERLLAKETRSEAAKRGAKKNWWHQRNKK